MTIDDDYDPRDEELDPDQHISQLIDEWLNDARPERYEYRERDDWMEEVYEKAAAALQEWPPQHVARDQARQLVRRHESDAGRRAFRFIRNLLLDGQVPLGWDGSSDEWRALCAGDLRLPLKIDKVRVRIGTASATDLKEWITAQLDLQTAKWAEFEMARNNVEWLIQQMHEQGVSRVEDLRFTDDAD